MRYTRHALDAMRRRHVSREEVEFVVKHAEQSYQGSRYGNEATVYQWRHLAVVADAQTVLTILLRSQEEWTDADMRARNAAERRRNGL